MDAWYGKAYLHEVTSENDPDPIQQRFDGHRIDIITALLTT